MFLFEEYLVRNSIKIPCVKHKQGFFIFDSVDNESIPAFSRLTRYLGKSRWLLLNVSVIKPKNNPSQYCFGLLTPKEDFFFNHYGPRIMNDESFYQNEAGCINSKDWSNMKSRYFNEFFLEKDIHWHNYEEAVYNILSSVRNKCKYPKTKQDFSLMMWEIFVYLSESYFSGLHFNDDCLFVSLDRNQQFIRRKAAQNNLLSKTDNKSIRFLWENFYSCCCQHFNGWFSELLANN